MPNSRAYDAYDGFAWFYHRFWAASYSKDVRLGMERFFLPLVPSGGRVLDLCCGSGVTSQWLNACRFEVVGLDGSEELLRIAREQAPGVRFVAGDARSFDAGEPFDAAVCLFDSVNHLESAAELRRVFRNVWQALAEPGLFLFDVNRHEGFLGWSPEVYTVVERDHALIAEATYEPANGVARSVVTGFRLIDGLWQRWDAEILEYCHSPETIAAALQDTGFSEFVRYDAAWDFGMPRGEGRTFYLAAKGEAPRWLAPAKATPHVASRRCSRGAARPR